MYWYHMLFLIVLNPWFVLLFLALGVSAYSSTGKSPVPSAEEIEAHTKKVAAEKGWPRI